MDPEKASMTIPGQTPHMAPPYAGPSSAPPPYNVQQGQPEAGQPYTQMYGYQSYGGGFGAQPYPTGQQNPAQPGAFTVQPAVYVTQIPLVNPVNDYMGYSIFTLICCCLPIGIAALIYSISTRDAILSGNQAEAERSSRTAKILNHVALGTGILIIATAVILVSVAYSVAFSYLFN